MHHELLPRLISLRSLTVTSRLRRACFRRPLTFPFPSSSCVPSWSSDRILWEEISESYSNRQIFWRKVSIIRQRRCMRCFPPSARLSREVHAERISPQMGYAERNGQGAQASLRVTHREPHRVSLAGHPCICQSHHGRPALSRVCGTFRASTPSRRLHHRIVRGCG